MADLDHFEGYCPYRMGLEVAYTGTKRFMHRLRVSRSSPLALRHNTYHHQASVAGDSQTATKRLQSSQQSAFWVRYGI